MQNVYSFRLYAIYVKKIGCHYNQSGVLKIDILILLRLARFQNLGTPPTGRGSGNVKRTSLGNSD